ncbi:MAG TPA: VOC family protein, partial [Hyphomicrobium sp.]|nr:VOC family protein [Hyphomicrobium sp.]
MTASSTLPAPNLMPLLRYRDLAAAMGWLEEAFGFEKQIAVNDSDGETIYGQMTYRGSLMMMGAVRDTDLDKLMRQPDEVGGVETQSCYIVVDDADEHYARARASGADVVLEIKSDGLGRRGYSCRDPEGHIWNFGTYNPGRGLSAALPPPAPKRPESRQQEDSPRLLMSLTTLIMALCVTCWWFSDEIRADFSKRLVSVADSAQEAERAYAELVKVRAEKRKADELAKALNRDLDAERARRIALETNASQQLVKEQDARRSAETTVASLRDELKRGQAALDAAVEAKRISEEKLAVRSGTPEPASKSVSVLNPGAAGPQSVPATEATSSPTPTRASEIETSATGLTSAAPHQTPIAQTPIALTDDTDDEPASRSTVRNRSTPRSSKWVQKPKRPGIVRAP